MSKYTTEVRYICETHGVGKNVDEIISSSAPKIFDFNFPIFDESYRSVLCCKILKHYYTREIAHETVGLWKLRLNTVLNEVMPYYNQLYKSELLQFNPLYDVDYKREGNRKSDVNKKVETTSSTNSEREIATEQTNNSLNKYSKTVSVELT